MQVVINISKDLWEDLQYYEGSNEIELAVEHGTVLPKGHGRLISADDFKKYCWDGIEDMRQTLEKYGHREMAEEVTKNLCRDIDEAPTVLEADKEE